MKIIKTALLSPQQIAEIQALETAAYKRYKLENHAFLSNDINFNRELPCFFLGYVGERLVAFLTIFVPTRQEAEIQAFTHPDFQKKGCFDQLLEEALRLLKAARIPDLLFALEPASKNGLATLQTFPGNRWERSEYRMTVCSLKKAPDSSGLQLFEVDNSNRALFRDAINLVFPRENLDNYCDAVISSDFRHGYMVYKNGPVGVFNLSTEHGGEAMLYGVGIAEIHRGNGYGSALMGHAMRQGLRLADRITLDVDSDNPVALSLYKKCGFQVNFQVDYYRWPIGKR